MALTRIPASGVVTGTTFTFNSINVTATTLTASTITGAIVITGGLGVGGGGYFGGAITATNVFVNGYAVSTASALTIQGAGVSLGTAGTLNFGTGTIVTVGTNLATVWLNTSTLMTTAVNLAGGTAGQFAYQTGAGATSFMSTGSMYVNRAVSADSATTATSAGTAYATIGTLTAGTGLTGTAFNGSANQTWTLNTATLMQVATQVVQSHSTGTGILGSSYNGSTAQTWTLDTSTLMARAVQTVQSLTAGTGLTGTAFNGSTAQTWTLNTATLMTTAVNLAGGSAGQFAYQTGAGATSFMSTGSMYVYRATIADSATGGAGSVTNSVTFNNAGSGDASGTTYNGSAARTISYNTLGAMPTTGGTFSGPVTFSGAVTFSGTATYVLSTNTWYTDNILELHVPTGGVSSPWFVDDGKDIGLRFHYYTNSTDTNAALVLANDTKWLEWYSAGAEGTSTFAGSAYGNFKTGGIWATTGAGVGYTSSQVGEKLGVNGGAYVNGTLTATTFVGALSQSHSAGTGLTGTAYNGSAAVTWTLNTATLMQVATQVVQSLSTGTGILGSSYNGSTAQTWSLNTTTLMQTAVSAINLSAGSAMALPYQSASGTTAYLAAGTSGYILQTNGTGSAPSWVAVSGLSAGTATNANNLSTVMQTANAVYYPTFVDSNNSAAAYEAYYTTSSIYLNPAAGALTVGAGGLDSSAALTYLYSSPATVDAFGSASTLSIGNYLSGNQTLSLYPGSIQSGFTKTIRIGGGGQSGSTTQVYIAANSFSTDATAQVFLGNAAGYTIVNATGGTSSTSTGALRVAGGLGVAGGGYFGSIVTATNFSGSLAGGGAMSLVYQSAANTTAYLAAGTSGYILQTNGTGSAPSWVAASGLSAGSSTNADNLKTIQQTASASYYPAFVDSNNSTAAYEAYYTTSSFIINPASGLVQIGTVVNDYIPSSGGGTTLRLNGLNYTSIGFHDSGNTIGNLKFSGSYGFEIGASDGLYGPHNTVMYGSVGVGTNSPGKKLTISRTTETTSEQLEFRVEGGITTGNYDGIVWTQGSSGGTTLSSIRLNYNSSGAPDMAFNLRNESNVLFLKNGGNVGVGTNTPAAKLHVSGTGAVPSPNATTSSNGLLRLRTSDAVYLDIGAYGTSPWTTWIQSGDTGSAAYYATSLNPLGGNVGVGTTTIGEKLTVAGAIRTTSNASNFSGAVGAVFDYYSGSARFATYDGTNLGTFYLNSTGSIGFGASSSYGSSGQVLQSNGNAAPTWVNQSSIAAGSAPLTSTYVGYGSASNLLTGSSNVTWDGSKFYVNGILDITGNSSPTGTGLTLGFNSTGGYKWIQSFNSQPLYINPLGNNVIFNRDSGNVGIGTTGPSGKLHVYTGVASGAIAYFEGDSGRYIYTGVDSGHYIEQVGTTSANRVLRIQSSNGSGTYTALYIDGANQRIYTIANANVGIGTSTPGSKLHVYTSSAEDGIIVEAATYPEIIFKTGGTNRGYLSYAGSGGGYGSTNSGMVVRSENANITFLTSGGSNQPMAITTNYVGIGTTSPVSKLHVAGAGNVTGGNIHLGDNTDTAAKWTYITAAHYNGATNPTGVSLIGHYASSTDNNINIGGNIYEANPATTIAFYTYTSNTHALGGTLRLTITKNGGFAFGTSASNYGSSGQILQSNGDAAPTWVNASSITSGYASNETLSTVATRGNSYINASTGGISIGESFTNYDGWNTQLNVHGGPHARIHVKTSTVRMGIYAHDSWQSVGGVTPGGFVGTYNNYPLSFLVNTSQRMVIDTSGNVIIGQTSISYQSGDNTPVVGSITNSLLHVNGSIQLTNNNDAIYIGRGTASFFKDEELGFGWGGGWYMTDSTYLRVRNNKTIYSADGEIDLRNSNATASTNRMYFNPYNGPSGGTSGYNYGSASGGGTSLGTGIVWAPNYSGYSKRSAGILNIAEGNYFRSGLAFYTNNITDSTTDWTEAMRIGSNGNVQIGGGSSPSLSNKFEVDGSNGQLFVVTDSFTGTIFSANDVSGIPSIEVLDTGLVKFAQYNGSVAISTSTAVSGSILTVNGIVSIVGSSGELRASSEITAYYSSDARLKENVHVISNPIEKLEQINGVYFDWTDEYIQRRGGEDGFFVRKNDIGVIAQEVEAVLPEIVATREDGYKAVKYEKIVPLLIEAVKSQQQTIDSLKAELQEIKDLIKGK